MAARVGVVRPRWRVTWWEGGSPSTRQAVERTATVAARADEA